MTKKDDDFNLDELFGEDEDDDSSKNQSSKTKKTDDDIDFEPTFDDEPEFDDFDDNSSKNSSPKAKKSDDDDFDEIELERVENTDEDDNNENDEENTDQNDNRDDDNGDDSDNNENQEDVVQKTSFFDKYKKYIITGVSLIAVTGGVYLGLPYALNMFNSNTSANIQAASQPPLTSEQTPPVQAPIRKKGNLNAENNQTTNQPQLGEQNNAQAPVTTPGPVPNVAQVPVAPVMTDTPVLPPQNEQPQIGSTQQSSSAPNVPAVVNQPVVVEQNSVPNPVTVSENTDTNSISSKMELLSSDVARLNQSVSDLTTQLSNMNLANLIGGLDMLNREVQALKANNNQDMLAKIQALEEKIANLEKKVSTPRRNNTPRVNNNRNSNSERTTANLNSEKTNSPKVVLDTKPKPLPVPQKSVKGYKLLGATINGDVASAILTDGSETKKVFIGDELPKVGKIKNIFMNNNNWFVETESGIIKYK